MLLKYWNLGLSVIPVEGKSAVVSEWSKWCYELPPKTLVEYWQKRFPFPKYGIGICCGPASGIDALDIDSNSKDILEMCPRSPLNRFGARGGMPLFKHNPKIIKRNQSRDNLYKTDDKKTEGIQILSVGNYFVAPPSIHPITLQPYRWVGEYSLENFSVLDLDYISQDEIDFICVYISRFPLTRANGSISMGGVEGRNNKLTSMCYAKLITNPEKLDEEIAEELLEYDQENHSPVYFTDPRDDYFRKASSPFGRALLFVKGSRARMRKKGHI